MSIYGFIVNSNTHSSPLLFFALRNLCQPGDLWNTLEVVQRMAEISMDSAEVLRWLVVVCYRASESIGSAGQRMAEISTDSVEISLHS